MPRRAKKFMDDRNPARGVKLGNGVSRDLKITDYVAIHVDWRDAFLRNFYGSVVQG